MAIRYLYKSLQMIIYVGCEMYSFKTDDEIIDYVSPMGNNDVPYPVAYSDENVYFMEGQFVKIKELATPVTVSNALLLSQEFYGHIPSKRTQTYHRMKNKMMIHKRLYS